MLKVDIHKEVYDGKEGMHVEIRTGGDAIDVIEETCTLIKNLKDCLSETADRLEETFIVAISAVLFDMDKEQIFEAVKEAVFEKEDDSE